MRLALGVLAVALAIVGSACGGDEDEAGTTGAPTTPAATVEPPATTQDDYARPEPADDQSRWARDVDAACTPLQEQIDAIAPPSDAADLDRWLGEALPLIRKQVAAVDAVARPPAQASSFVDGLRRVEQALTRYRQALDRGDAQAAQEALAEAGAAGSASRDAALEVGVTECGGYTQG